MGGRTGTNRPTTDTPRGKPDQPIRPTSLISVVIGVICFVAGAALLYVAMRSVGLEQGGSCASGGPYEIRPGQECKQSDFGYAAGGIVAMMVSVGVFLWGSWRFGGSLVTTSASAACFCGFFGVLGGSFARIGADMPASMPDSSEFSVLGVVFLVMAAIGLVVVVGPVVFTARTKRLDVAKVPLRAWGMWFGSIAVSAAIGTAIGGVIIDAVA